MERAADAQRIVKVILRSLDWEPVSVTRLSEEFGIDRAQIRRDIGLWIDQYGEENPDDAYALMNWRDSHVAPNAIRDGYIDLALRLSDRNYDMKCVAEIIGVDYQQLNYWMRRAGVEPSFKTRGKRQEERFASSSGDLSLKEHLEKMRQQTIRDARAEFSDEIAAVEQQ
jgi:hypothetical protein